MSLPCELRTICHLLSTTEPPQLPYITPTLLRNLFSCGDLLSADHGNVKAADASESLVLVHKFKIQITTLLTGKESGGRFAAVLLIKAVVELGGWEILKGAEPWVRGLLQVLKSDAPVVKSLCILTLASIYTMTRQYQTLVREITTPTLPTFVTSCLNLLSKSTPSPTKDLSGQESMVESVFEAFAILLPRHPTIFRPFTSQIQHATRLYVAPTMSGGCFVPQSLRESARRVTVTIHQTAPKNASADEWAKALRLHIRATHVTADQVFRAVVEDWESVSGYVGGSVDSNAAVQGGSKSAEDFPEWSGIHDGVERLIGMLALLGQYLKSPTAAAVSIPVDALKDVLSRMLSLTKPTRAGSGRLNPAIDRDEREGLWAGLPRIHVASMQLLMSVADRLQAGFLPLAQESLDRVTWLFRCGPLDEEVRTNAYLLVARLLCCGGPMLPKNSVESLSPLVSACCVDLLRDLPAVTRASGALSSQREGTNRDDPNNSGANSNADTFLQRQSNAVFSVDSTKYTSELVVAASRVLPLFLSDLPQAHLGAKLRFDIERTAVIIHHKETMVNSVLNPFADNSRTLPSPLPHLNREFPDAPVVEALLRPRLPPMPQVRSELVGLNDDVDIAPEEMAKPTEPTIEAMKGDGNTGISESRPSFPQYTMETKTSFKRPRPEISHDPWVTRAAPVLKRGKFERDAEQQAVITSSTATPVTQSVSGQNAQANIEDDSDNESTVSLKMEFDSESDE